MKKRRRFTYARPARESEKLDEGQDSFLDVVSNLVGVLIILVMIAGARVRNVASELETRDGASSETAQKTVDPEEQERQAYVAAVEALEEKRAKVEQARREADDISERVSMVERQAQAAEEEYRQALVASAELEGALALEAKQRDDSEKVAFELKSEIFQREKKLDDLKREKEALEAARPQATVLENLPTPIAQRVAEGREGFFCLKNGKISHVPLNEFQERVRLFFKNYRFDQEQTVIDEKIGPSDNYYFHYIVDLNKIRDAEGMSYYLQFRYGECIPTNDAIGEPVDVALSNRQSVFYQRLMKYDRNDTVVTLFVYPDSYQYLKDVKKFLFSLKYQAAFRPLPDGAPIAISPNGTASATY